MLSTAVQCQQEHAVSGAGIMKNAECCSSIRPVDRAESALASYDNTSRASTFCTAVDATVVEARVSVVEEEEEEEEFIFRTKTKHKDE